MSDLEQEVGLVTLQQPLEMTGNTKEGLACTAGPRLVVLAGNALGAPGNRRGSLFNSGWS